MIPVKQLKASAHHIMKVDLSGGAQRFAIALRQASDHRIVVRPGIIDLHRVRFQHFPQQPPALLRIIRFRIFADCLCRSASLFLRGHECVRPAQSFFLQNRKTQRVKRRECDAGKHIAGIRPRIAFPHLLRSSSGKCQHEDLFRPYSAIHEFSRARCDHSGLSGTRTGQHQTRAFPMQDRRFLFSVPDHKKIPSAFPQTGSYDL